MPLLIIQLIISSLGCKSKPHLPKKKGFETVKRPHAFWKQRQEDCRFELCSKHEANPGFTASPCFKNTKVKFKNKRIHGRLRACIIPSYPGGGGPLKPLSWLHLVSCGTCCLWWALSSQSFMHDRQGFCHQATSPAAWNVFIVRL